MSELIKCDKCGCEKSSRAGISSLDFWLVDGRTKYDLCETCIRNLFQIIKQWMAEEESK